MATELVVSGDEPKDQRDRLIDYLLRFWYREPSRCMNRQWIEEHADEILEVVK